MLKKYCSVVLLLLCSPLFAQHTYDTLSVKEVSSGVTHYHIKGVDVTWDMQVLKIDLQSPFITLKSVKSQDNIHDYELVTSMARRNDSEGKRVVGAINADFFLDNGTNTGYQVAQGELVTTYLERAYFNQASKIGIDKDNAPFITRNTLYNGKLIAKGKEKKIDGINIPRPDGALILYNHFIGESTKTDTAGVEVLISPISDWLVNDAVKCVIISKEKSKGNMSFERGNAVLSANGAAKSFLTDSLAVGDTLECIVNIAHDRDKIKELVSGYPRLVKDGKDYAIDGFNEEGGMKFRPYDRHPRTGAGYSDEGRYFYFVVVDGRQSSSVGMTLPEMGQFMASIGIDHGINLDGGGSSTMVVRHKIANSPSGGSERAVAEALIVQTSENFEMVNLDITPDTVVTDLKTDVQLSNTALDRYGYTGNIDFSEISFEFQKPDIGTVDSEGKFHPQNNGLSQVIATFKEVKDTFFVNVEKYDGIIGMSSFEKEVSIPITGENIDTLKCTSEVSKDFSSDGEAALKINYSFTYESGKKNRLEINTNLPVPGLPDSLSVDIKADNPSHSFVGIFETQTGDQFLMLLKKCGQSGDFSTYKGAFKNLIKMHNSYVLSYPLRLQKLIITLASDNVAGTVYTGTTYFDNIAAIFPTTVGVEDSKELPSSYQLAANYPNPFNPSTTISFSLPREEHVSMKVFNTLGEEVAELVNNVVKAGTHSISFNANNLSSGVYFYTITAGNYRATRKMILMK